MNMNSIDVTIDNREVTVPVGSTILEAAQKLDIHIPTLCYMKGYEHSTSCMICVVHDIKSGRLVPACSMPVEQGMRIETENERIREARKDTLDFLLSEHVGDCEAPCRLTCPANMDIPLMIRQIKEKQFADAIVTVKRDIALPAVLGRICPAPCEKGCNRKFYDSPVSICYLKRFVADIDLALDLPYCPVKKEKSGKKVAIVGAGPAGLSAAYYLLQDGHECFVYDKNPQPGGMLRYGVPDEKLPKTVLDMEIERISVLGAHFYMGQSLGKDFSLEELKNNYDAVVLSLGTIEAGIFENSGINLTRHGIAVNRKTFETSVPGVFAGGNAVVEGRMAILASAHGKNIGYSINQYLNNMPVTGPVKRFNSRIGKRDEKEVEELAKGSGKYGQITPKGGFPKGYRDTEAIKESSRCFICDCRKPDSCKLRQYAEEYNADQRRYKLTERKKFEKVLQHDLVIYEPGKCIKCGLCVKISERSGESFGLTFVNRGFNTRIEPPFNEPMSRALQKTAKECIDACPTGALSHVASGGQGLFLKKPPLDPAKTFDKGE
jgi:NADPH-dependent glutamate synthase beta subunit-like oxidoreductase